MQARIGIVRLLAAIGPAWAIAIFVVPSTVSAATAGDPVTAWFDRGRCEAYPGGIVPRVHRQRDDDLRSDVSATTVDRAIRSHPLRSNAWYLYDRRMGVAFRHMGGDSDMWNVVRFANPPPAALTETNLSNVRTISGVRLGSNAESVVATLGKPSISRACGIERYVYYREPSESQPDDLLEFTIERGRVIEIASETNG